MKKTLRLLITSLIVLTPLTACSNAAPSEQTSNVRVESVSLNKKELSLHVGDEFTLVATISPIDATNKSVRFQSSNNSVATISSSGLVVAKKIGKSSLSVITLDGSKAAVCKLTVVDDSSPVDPVDPVDPEEDLCTISFNSNGGTGYMSPVTDINRGSPYTAPSCSFTPPTNKEFAGWKIDNAGALLPVGNVIYITGDCVFYAQWTDSYDPDNPNYFDEHDLTMQDYTVLHCWSWKMSEIQANLDKIKNAGFKSIQISPMQPQLDYYYDPNYAKWEDQWWKLYQPLGFTIATGNNQNVLGNKDDLRNLCSSASQKGIKIIVDVVANHLAGGNDKQLNWNVQNIEPEIYNQNLIHTLGNKTAAQDPTYNSHTDWIVQGAIGGFPDLQTENPIVQNRVLSLLKEYIDVGVSGFRFDAAKHIETPDDGEYASNFWPTVLNGATEYATNKGKDKPYYYGEILTTPGTKRSFDWYTKYMSVTDDEEGTKVIDAVNNHAVGPVAYTSRYKTTLEGKYLMLWGESHDTYANTWGYTKDMDQEAIDKAYVLQTTRARANSLYFSRATHNTIIGTATSDAYSSNLIKCANNFHSKLVNLKENIFESEGCYVNERGTRGIAVIRMANTSGNVTISLQNVKEGTYINLLDGKSYTVTNKTVTLSLVDDIALLIRSDINQ